MLCARVRRWVPRCGGPAAVGLLCMCVPLFTSTSCDSAQNDVISSGRPGQPGYSRYAKKRAGGRAAPRVPRARRTPETSHQPMNARLGPTPRKPSASKRTSRRRAEEPQTNVLSTDVLTPTTRFEVGRASSNDRCQPHPQLRSPRPRLPDKPCGGRQEQGRVPQRRRGLVSGARGGPVHMRTHVCAALHFTSSHRPAHLPINARLVKARGQSARDALVGVVVAARRLLLLVALLVVVGLVRVLRRLLLVTATVVVGLIAVVLLLRLLRAVVVRLVRVALLLLLLVAATVLVGLVRVVLLLLLALAALVLVVRVRVAARPPRRARAGARVGPAREGEGWRGQRVAGARAASRASSINPKAPPTTE